MINLNAYSLYDNYYEAFQEEGDFSPEDILNYIYIKESHPNGLNDILEINSVSGGTLYLNPLPTGRKFSAPFIFPFFLKEIA